MKNCDMCQFEIVNGKCSCGEWKNSEEMKSHPIKLSLELFHDLKTFSLTSDAPYLGCACIFFRGDYNDCKKIEKFICEMKQRPGYLKNNP